MLKKATFIKKSRFFLLLFLLKKFKIRLISGRKCHKVGRKTMNF